MTLSLLQRVVLCVQLDCGKLICNYLQSETVTWCACACVWVWRIKNVIIKRKEEKCPWNLVYLHVSNINSTFDSIQLCSIHNYVYMYRNVNLVCLVRLEYKFVDCIFIFYVELFIYSFINKKNCWGMMYRKNCSKNFYLSFIFEIDYKILW